ncbi:MAG: hypothetical protein AB7G38_10200, partial [Dehalococcoidia bacterium]
MGKHIHLRIAGLIVAMAMTLGSSMSLPGIASADGLLDTGIDVQVLEQGGGGGISSPTSSDTSEIVDDVVDVVEGESTTVLVTDDDETVIEATAGLGGEPVGPTCDAITCGNNTTVEGTTLLPGPDAPVNLQVDVAGEDDDLLEGVSEPLDDTTVSTVLDT